KIKSASKIVVLTGAGISAESNIPTFRDKGGLWEKYDPQLLASISYFRQNPQKVWEWYNWRRKLISSASPNKGHFTLSELEQWSEGNKKNFTLITQNVDGLHEKA